MKPAATLPVVYIVFRKNAGASSTRFGGFISRLVKAGHMPQASYKTIALEDLTFVINTANQAAIYNADGSQIFHDAAFVYFKSWESMDELAAMVVQYLRAKGIPFEDAAVGHAGKHKASQMWRLWANGLPVIPTILAPGLPAQAEVAAALGPGPYITKPIHGEKGRGIAYHADYAALKQAQHDWSQYLLQPFIANKGDWRVMVYGYEVRGALYRQAAPGLWLNNTSQGASSTFVVADETQESVRQLAVQAAEVAEYAVAGVDIVVGGDNIARVLEVNQGSQIVTGHSCEAKMKAFGDYMHEVLAHRYTRKAQNSRLPVLGRYVHVNLPELKIKNIFTKVDTGAYQSAIHATDIREVQTKHGTELEFTLLAGHPRSVAERESARCRVKDYQRARIKNSFGITQDRYIIKTRISIRGRMMKTGITLTDRKDMVAPLLLGRRFLRGRYLVNVELSRLGFERS